MTRESTPEVRAEQVVTEAIGNVTYWRATIGPRNGDVVFKITGLNLATASPFCVVFQSRQLDNIDHGWPDQFAIQVIETSNDFIRVRIRRIDSPGSGWAQQLGLNFIVRE
jgi:hypothetical protein